MERKIDAFYKQAGITKTQSLTQTLKTFLQKKENRVIYRDKQIYFLTQNRVVDAHAIVGIGREIVEFDGNNLSSIDDLYYLGTNMENQRIMLQSATTNQTQFETEYSSHSNNNNNNNNGNNNG